MDGEKGIFEWKYWTKTHPSKSSDKRTNKEWSIKTEIHPFVYTKIPTAEPKECDLTIDEFRKYRIQKLKENV